MKNKIFTAQMSDSLIRQALLEQLEKIEEWVRGIRFNSISSDYLAGQKNIAVHLLSKLQDLRKEIGGER